MPLEAEPPTDDQIGTQERSARKSRIALFPTRDAQLTLTDLRFILPVHTLSRWCV